MLSADAYQQRLGEDPPEANVISITYERESVETIGRHNILLVFPPREVDTIPVWAVARPTRRAMQFGSHERFAGPKLIAGTAGTGRFGELLSHKPLHLRARARFEWTDIGRLASGPDR